MITRAVIKGHNRHLLQLSSFDFDLKLRLMVTVSKEAMYNTNNNIDMGETFKPTGDSKLNDSPDHF